MARPCKQGLDYFPLDVDFLRNPKVRRITKAQGFKAVPVLICLLSNIYRGDGYYLKKDGDTHFLIAEESGVEECVVTEVLSKALKIGFFDAGIYEEYKVLTSEEIQETYFFAIKNAKRKKIAVIEEFLLINPSEVPKTAVWGHATTAPKIPEITDKSVNYGNNSVNYGINEVNYGNNQQRKEKERRLEKRENVEKRNAGNNSSTAIPQSVLDVYQTEIRPIASSVELEKLTDDVSRYGETAVIKAVQRAAIRNKRSIGYVEGILRKWEVNGYDEESPPNRPKDNPQLAIAKQAMDMLRGANIQ